MLRDRRSTPTHVGNTSAILLWRHTMSVHPHARGEYVMSFAPSADFFGPPPRTWGILLQAFRDARGERSTPTHVGNTSTIRSSGAGDSVHPHARGEYSPQLSILSPRPGPPPRTWGILAGGVADELYRRSTPTHVGNTLRPQWRARPESVHPHARGEYQCSTRRAISRYGPPPRTWGILEATVPCV